MQHRYHNPAVTWHAYSPISLNGSLLVYQKTCFLSTEPQAHTHTTTYKLPTWCLTPSACLALTPHRQCSTHITCAVLPMQSTLQQPQVTAGACKLMESNPCIVNRNHLGA
jgi:hypothetical protein